MCQVAIHTNTRSHEVELPSPILEALEAEAAEHNLVWDPQQPTETIPRFRQQRTTGWRCRQCKTLIPQPLSLMDLNRIFSPGQGYCPVCYPGNGKRRHAWRSAVTLPVIKRRRGLTWMGDPEKFPSGNVLTRWKCEVEGCGCEFDALLAQVLLFRGCPSCGTYFQLNDYHRIGRAAGIILCSAWPAQPRAIEWQCGHNPRHKFRRTHHEVYLALQSGTRICPHCPSDHRAPLWVIENDCHSLASRFSGFWDGPLPERATSITNWRCQNGHRITTSYRIISGRLNYGYAVCLCCAGLVRPDSQPIDIAEAGRALEELQETKARVAQIVISSSLEARRKAAVGLRLGLGKDQLPGLLDDAAKVLGGVTREAARTNLNRAYRKAGISAQDIKILLRRRPPKGSVEQKTSAC